MKTVVIDGLLEILKHRTELFWKLAEEFDVVAGENKMALRALEEMREQYRQVVADSVRMRKERDELRKRCRYNLDPGAQITCWDEYERVITELEELRNHPLIRGVRDLSRMLAFTEAHDDEEAK